MELENTKNSNVDKVISNHNYGNKDKQQALDFNKELYNHLHCDYTNITENKYFNETTKEEIKQQEEDLKKLKRLYKKKDSIIEYRNKLNEYLEKYVYSKRKWEDFRESEVKHDIGHNLRLEYLVENILNEVEKTINKDNKEELQKFEQFKKDAITFAVMHDITHRGSPDFTDHESSIQFITFIKEMGSAINYSQNILADKDKENIQVEKEDEKRLTPMDKDAYINTVVRQLEYIPETTVIERITGDGSKENLIAPLWSLDKISVLGSIDKEMSAMNTYQGILFT